MSKVTPKDNWTEEQWHKQAKTLIGRIRKAKFEFGKLVAEFHDHFNRHRDQYQEDWTVVCQRVLTLKHPTCSLYETIWRVLGKVEFRDQLPPSLHTLHKIAMTYSTKPEIVVRAVAEGKINVETTEKETDQLFLSDEVNREEGRDEKKPGHKQEIGPVIERDILRLYGLYGRALVDRAMIIKMFAAEIGEVERRWENRWDTRDIIHTLKSHYNIVDEDLDEARARAKAEDLLQISYDQDDSGESDET